MSVIYHSQHLYTEEGIMDGYMEVTNGRITKISKTYIQGQSFIDFHAHYIFPGIIDIHNHGYLGWSAKTIDRQEIKGLSLMLASIGVTAALATTSAWEKEEFHMLEEIAMAIKEGCTGAKILGIHMEGPFFHPNKHNATAVSEVQGASIHKTKKYVEAAQGYLRYMTLAPDIEHAYALMDYLKEEGIHIGCGHTQARFKDFQVAKAHGMESSIHTGNAMNQITQREVGLMGGALLDADIYCELICDGFHIAPEMLELMFRIKKDTSKFIMISDSDLVSGIAPGTYWTFDKNVHVQENGSIVLDDGTINGSSKHIVYGIQNLLKNLHRPMEEVINMCTRNPATFLGLQHEIGSIAEGKYADFIVLNSDFMLQETYVNGVRKYKLGDPLYENPKFTEICKRVR